MLLHCVDRDRTWMTPLCNDAKIHGLQHALVRIELQLHSGRARQGADALAPLGVKGEAFHPVGLGLELREHDAKLARCSHEFVQPCGQLRNL
jgi:hypothetical protein